MDTNRDEVAEFGRAADAGRNQDIEPGGTLAERHGDHRRHPDDAEEQTRRRKPPQGRSHAAV
jgi:hypothetical protein